MSLHPRKFYRRTPERYIDFLDVFCGGGGASTAIKAATGKSVSVAINHNEIAIAVHKTNHPETDHLLTDVFSPESDPRRVLAKHGCGYVESAWFSPDCTDHSNAKGGKPIEKDTRILAWVVLDWVREGKVKIGYLENVPEFVKWGPLIRVRNPKRWDAGRKRWNAKAGKKWIWKRDPKREGETFRQFVGQLELLGYKVEWRNLTACDYGAPTKRKRLFMVFRRDGLPIVWPEPTHGDAPGLKPFHTAAECIDWSIPGRSIFGRKHPLAEKTMWRIAQGLKRFVFENADPFIIAIDNGSSEGDRSRSIHEPAPTIVTKNRLAVVAPHLVKVNHGKREARGESLEEPLSTVTAARRGHALVAAVLQHSGNGERPTQRARVYDLDEPLGTVMATGQKHALVMAFLSKYFGDPLRTEIGKRVVGQSLKKPIGTVTTRDHNALAAVTLVNYRGSDEQHPGCWDVDRPFPTISAQGIHGAEVRAFLTAYYGDDHAPGHGQEVLRNSRQ